MPHWHETDSLVARNMYEDKSIAFSWKRNCESLFVALRAEITIAIGSKGWISPVKIKNWIQKLGRKDLVVRNLIWYVFVKARDVKRNTF